MLMRERICTLELTATGSKDSIVAPEPLRLTARAGILRWFTEIVNQQRRRYRSADLGVRGRSILNKASFSLWISRLHQQSSKILKHDTGQYAAAPPVAKSVQRDPRALSMFAKMRYAPGTAAGNSRNQEKALKMYTPLP